MQYYCHKITNNVASWYIEKEVLGIFVLFRGSASLPVSPWSMLPEMFYYFFFWNVLLLRNIFTRVQRWKQSSDYQQINGYAKQSNHTMELSLKKEGNSDIRSNMDELWRLYAS